MFRYLLLGLAIVGAMVALFIGSSGVDLGAMLPDNSKSGLREEVATLTESRLQLRNEVANLQAQLALAHQQNEQMTQALARAQQEADEAKPKQPTVQARPDTDTRALALAQTLEQQLKHPPSNPKPPPKPPPVRSELDRDLARLRDQQQQVPDSRQRLLGARAAVVDGRTNDATRLLEEAQTQIVFQPGTPSQDVSGYSVAAQRIAKAITALNAGNAQTAIQNIDAALNSL